jgi:hypothetical protein
MATSYYRNKPSDTSSICVQTNTARSTGISKLDIITYTGLDSDSQSVQLTAKITGLKTNEKESASYYFTGAFRRSKGIITQIDSTLMIAQSVDTSSWSATFVVKGTNILIQVAGDKASIIDWRAVLESVKNV